MRGRERGSLSGGGAAAAAQGGRQTGGQKEETSCGGMVFGHAARGRVVHLLCMHAWRWGCARMHVR